MCYNEKSLCYKLADLIGYINKYNSVRVSRSGGGGCLPSLPWLLWMLPSSVAVWFLYSTGCFEKVTLIHGSVEPDIWKIKKGYLTLICMPKSNIHWWTSILCRLLIANSVLLDSLYSSLFEARWDFVESLEVGENSALCLEKVCVEDVRIMSVFMHAHCMFSQGLHFGSLCK